MFSAWDEIYEVFGDGHEYDWALAGDDNAAFEKEQIKSKMKYQDISSTVSYFCFSLIFTYLPRYLSPLKFKDESLHMTMT